MKQDTASGAGNDSRNKESRKIIFEMGLKDAAFEQDKESDSSSTGTTPLSVPSSFSGYVI